MKIEIDFSKPEDLRKTKADLEMALATIDSALAQINMRGDLPASSQPRSQVSEPHATLVLSQENGLSLIQEQPNVFTASQVFEMAEIAGIPRSAARRQIIEALELGIIILTEKGQGRRPSSYRKV